MTDYDFADDWEAMREAQAVFDAERERDERAIAEHFADRERES